MTRMKISVPAGGDNTTRHVLTDPDRRCADSMNEMKCSANLGEIFPSADLLLNCHASEQNHFLFKSITGTPGGPYQSCGKGRKPAHWTLLCPQAMSNVLWPNSTTSLRHSPLEILRQNLKRLEVCKVRTETLKITQR